MKVKKLVIVIILAFVSLIVKSQNIGWDWAKQSKGPITANGDAARGIITDTNGNIYITGSFHRTIITFGNTTLTNDTTNGSSDIFLVKYDSLGNVLWGKSAG